MIILSYNAMAKQLQNRLRNRNLPYWCNKCPPGLNNSSQYRKWNCYIMQDDGENYEFDLILEDIEIFSSRVRLVLAEQTLADTHPRHNRKIL